MKIALYMKYVPLRSQFVHSTIVYSLEVEHCTYRVIVTYTSVAMSQVVNVDCNTVNIILYLHITVGSHSSSHKV